MSGYAVIAALALVSSPTGVPEPVPATKADVVNILQSSRYRSYPEYEVVAWEKDLRKQLKRNTADRAADAIAEKYGFTTGDMRRLVGAWIVAQARQYDTKSDWKRLVQRELYALIPAARRSPVGLTIVAEALDAIDECSAADFQAMMEGSTDRGRDAYIIAAAATCDGNFVRATTQAADRAMPVLIRYANWGSLPLEDSLPVYAWLTSPAALRHVRDVDRRAVETLLWQRYLAALFKAGMNKRALTLFDGLTPEIREGVISPHFELPAWIEVDGIIMSMQSESESVSATASAFVEIEYAADEAVAHSRDQESTVEIAGEAGQPETTSEGPVLEIAQALAIAERKDEARHALASLPQLAAAKAAAKCLYANTGPEAGECAITFQLPMDALVLDHLLNAGDADPYPIAEIVLSSSNGSETPAGAEVRCRVFQEADYHGLCAAGRANAAANAALNGSNAEAMNRTSEHAASEAALTLAVPDFMGRKAEIMADAEARPTFEPAPASSRTTVAAIPPPFEELAIPLECVGKAKPEPRAGFSSLPQGFALVRAERVGKKAVAISLSQTFDPTGEVSGGGYWVHLSDDGGKHWRKPLYTGLADHFPYVVVKASRLPLLVGDTLQLAVDVAEIDTASITYPPVGLRTRRRASGRYLVIPLGDLQRDSDGDGLTDLAARHLLLDRPKGERASPFIVGSDTSTCPTLTPARLALIGLLNRLSDPTHRAIVEPVDRPSGDIMTGVLSAEAAIDRPLFIKGKAQDYACLRSQRTIIVYDEHDILALERFTPDFQALNVPPIIFNRIRDRGYVNWSVGWAGGTYRLRLVSGKWEFDEISSWIS